MVLFIVQVALLVGSLAWGWYSSRSHRPDFPNPSGLSTGERPTSHDKPIPVVWGHVWLRSPQVLWWGRYSQVFNFHPNDDRYEPESESTQLDTLISGWQYFVHIHIALCHGPIDGIHGMKVDAVPLRTYAGAGNLSRQLYITSTSMRIVNGVFRHYAGRVIDDEAFIGQEMIWPYTSGEFSIFNGEVSQAFNFDGENDMVGSSPAIPDFKGVVTLASNNGPFAPAANGIYLGSKTPALRPWQFEVERILTGWDGNAQWYSAKAAVMDGAELVGMNPAHILRELLVSKDWGLGEATSAIDAIDFTAAADALFAEKLGLNLVWESQSSVRELLDEVCKHIEGVLWFDASRAKWRLKLIRADYVLGSTPTLDESAVLAVDGPDRSAWHDLPNQVTVTFRNAVSWDDEQVTVHNQAAQAAQSGRVVATTVRYAGVTSRTLAERLASRDLRQSGAPLARVTLRVLKSAGETLNPGDVVRWSWPDLGIVQMPLRVLSVNIGDTTKHEVVIRCVEDAFGMGDSLFTQPTDSYWEDPHHDPIAPTSRYLYPAPYWLARRGITTAETVYAVNPNAGWVAHAAARPLPDSPGYALDASYDGTTYDQAIQFAGWARRTTLNGGGDDIGRGVAALVVHDAVSAETWPVGTLLLVRGATPADDELVVVSAVDSATKTLTVVRGVLDTAPRELLDGSEVWGPQTSTVVPLVLSDPDVDTLYTKARTITLRGTLALADATADESPVTNKRYARPYPPQELKFRDGDRATGFDLYPVELMRGGIRVDWEHRTRAGSEALAPGGSTKTLESNVRYRLRVDGGTLHDTGDPWGGAPLLTTAKTYDIPASVFAGLADGDAVEVAIHAVRDDGLESWQALLHVVTLWVNLFADNVRTGTDTDSNTGGFTEINGATINTVTSYAHLGTRSLECIGIYAFDGFFTESVAAAVAATHAASVWLRVASGTLDVSVHLRNDTTATNGTPVAITLTTAWQQVDVVSPAVNVADALQLHVVADVIGTFYADSLALRVA